MINLMVKAAHGKVQEMIKIYGEEKGPKDISGADLSSPSSSREPKQMCLAGEVSDLLADSMLASVFGINSI